MSNSIWYKRIKRIVLRKEPAAIFSWRYFLPGQEKIVKVHRKALIYILVYRPWELVSFILWYLFYGWRQSFITWRQNNERLRSAYNLCRWKQLAQLLIMAFIYCIPPKYFYRYRLYLQRRKQWVNYIYTNELPAWHKVHSKKAEKQHMSLLSYKHFFAKTLGDAGLPAVPTLARWDAGEVLTKEQVFQEKSIFFKPDSESRKRGCMSLRYVKTTQQYHLQIEEDKVLTDREEIFQELNKRIKYKSYLMQALLENHAWFKRNGVDTELVVFRLITGIENCLGKCISAVMEIPILGKLNRAYPMAIDTFSGRISTIIPEAMSDNSAEEYINKLERVQIPVWREMKSLAEQAHGLCESVKTIGWDVAYTSNGLMLLEGNFNWGVDVHQLQENKLVPYFASNA